MKNTIPILVVDDRPANLVAIESVLPCPNTTV